MAAFKALATVAFMALVGAALHAGVTPAHADGATSPLVSVMVITHDRPQYLLHALQQIKEQDYPNLEVVIVDDSTHSFSHSMPEAVEALLDERVHYIYSPERMSIGEKRNLALARSSGDVMITWDDDDLYRTHRISTQVAPILAGETDITTFAHGMYLFAKDMQFYQWKLEDTPASPHFGTLAFSRAVADSGVAYPETSFGEDFGFAVRALDQGFQHDTLDNSDGTFTYVRHHAQNTWQINSELLSTMMLNMRPVEVPAWVPSRSLAFYSSLPEEKPAPEIPALRFPSGLHTRHEQLDMLLRDESGTVRRLTTYYTATPTITSSNGASGSSTANNVLAFTCTFSGTGVTAVTGMTEAAFNLDTTLATSTSFTAVSDLVYTLEVTLSAPTSGDVKVSVQASQAGVSPTTAASGVYTLSYAAPTVAITSDAGATGVTTASNAVVFTATFSSAVTGVTESDFNLATTNTLATSTTFNVVSGTVATLSVTVSSRKNGDVSVNFAASSTTPINAASSTFTISYAPPTVAITSDAGATGTTTSSATIMYTATFSSAVTGVTESDFNLATTNTLATSTTFNVVSGTVATLSVTVSSRKNGDVSVNFAESSVVPPNVASATFTVSYAPPTVTITGSSLDSSNRFYNPSLTLTATFSSAVTGVNSYTQLGFATTPADAWASAPVITASSSTVYILTVTLNAVTSSTGSIAVAAGLADDASGVSPPTAASGTLSATYYPPRVTFPGGATLTTGATDFDVDVSFAYGPSGNTAPALVSGVTTGAFSVTAGSGITATAAAVVSSGCGSTSPCASWKLSMDVRSVTATSSVTVTITAPAASPTVVSPANSNGNTLTVTFQPTAASLAVTVASSGATVTDLTAITAPFKLGVSFARGGSTLTGANRPTGFTASAMQLQLGSYIASSAYTASGDPTGSTGYTVSFGDTTAKTSAIGAYVDITETATAPQLTAFTPVALKYTCATCGVKLVYDVNTDVILNNTRYGPMAASSSSYTHSYWATGGTSTVAATGIRNLGKLAANKAAGPAVWYGRAAMDTNRYWDLRYNVHVYDAAWTVNSNTVRYSGGTTTLTWTSGFPATVSASIELQSSTGSVLSDLAVSDATSTTSVGFNLPATLPSGTYNLRFKTLSSPAVTGANGALVLERTTTVTVQNPYTFVTGAWTCPVSCGAGTRTRSVQCKRVTATLSSVVADSFCTAMGQVKPSGSEACPNLPACATPTWSFGLWTTCSATCGGGTQTRTATCLGTLGQTLTGAAANTACGVLAATQTSRSCNSFSCPTYIWASFAYGDCSASCGNDAVRTRYVACKQEGVTKFVADSACSDAGTKPLTTQACTGLPACDQPFWEAGEWSTCSLECGGGTATRPVKCFSRGGVEASDEATCVNDAGAGAKPATTKACNSAPCYTLFVGSYSACSADCGGGTSTRDVSCISAGQVVANSFCTGAGITLPASSRVCNTQACPKANLCAGANPCRNGGECDPSVPAANANSIPGGCDCAIGFTGATCEVEEGCPDGTQVTDVNGVCCAGDLNADGTCCPSAVHDVSTGACCGIDKAQLNSCGQCTADANENVQLDSNGECCAPEAIADGGVCCVGVVDECGKCNGIGKCPRTVNIQVDVPDVSTATELYASGWIDALIADVRAKMNLPADAIVEIELTVVTGSGRRLAVRIEHGGRVLVSTAFDTKILVSPTGTVLPSTIMGDLASKAATLDVGTGSVASVSAPVVSPVCGNDECEVGETCTETNEDSCCIADCPVRHLQCSTTITGTPCSGNGLCSYSGDCECAPGYTGDDCGSCADGFTRSDTDKCRRFTIDVSTVKPAVGGLVVFAIILFIIAVIMVAFYCYKNREEEGKGSNAV